MAVEDKYVDTAVAAGNAGSGFATQGREVKQMRKTFEIAAADDNASVYRVFKNINPHMIITKIEVSNDVITAGTDYDIGLYETGVGGVVIDKDVLGDGLDLSTAHAVGSELSGLSIVDVANAEKALFELVSQSIGSLKGGYDLCVTANVVGTSAGTVTLVVSYIEQF